MKTNSFNIQNVILLTKNRIIESKRKLLLQALLYYGIILCIGFFWLSITDNDLMYMIMYTAFFAFFFAINIASFFANILEDIRTKETNCIYFMIPASLSEKFVSRLVFIVIKCILLLGVTFVLAELTRSVLNYMLGMPNANIFLSFSQNHNAGLIPTANIFNTTWSIWGITTFMLGGCWYRKKAFNKVILWHLLIYIIIMIAGVNQFFNLIKTGGFFFPEDYLDARENLVNVISTLLILLSVFNIWLSYRLFKRRQIIK